MIEKFSKEYIEFLDKNRLLPIKEMAKILNLHPATLRSFAKTNAIKHIRIGKKYYFNLEDVKNSNVDKKELPNGIILNNGYIKINVGAEFPNADANGYVPLHKIIHDAYKFKLEHDVDSIISFKDGNQFNFKINNLQSDSK